MAISLNGFIAGTGISSLTGTVSLWYTTGSLPSLKTPTFVSLVSAVNAGGIPVCANGTWIQVSNNSQNATFSFTPIVGNNFYANDFRFSGFDATATTGQTNATFMAIVIAFDTLPATATYTLNYVELMAGDIATRPGAQKTDEVQGDCNYYIRKSFLPGTTPATNVGLGTGESVGQQASAASSSGRGPAIRFDNPMIGTPAITIYNPAASDQQIYDSTKPGSWSNSAAAYITANGFATQGTTPGGSNAGDYSQIHWLADARLGWTLLSL